MKPDPSLNDPLTHLGNINFLVENGGEISIGRLGPVRCGAVATDEDNCLAMLNRRPGETLYQLLIRLDQAIDRAWKDDEFTDEINGSN
jgi:hypothetical protein